MTRSRKTSWNERWRRPIQAAFAGLLIFLTGHPSPAETPDPDFYLRKSNWHASLLASLEALAGRGLEDVFEPFDSATMRGGDPAQSIRIPLHGATELYLFVTGVPDARWGVADWADARIVRDDGSAEWVSKSRGPTCCWAAVKRTSRSRAASTRS